jgi:pimeloyl-ACP methyl ester carboxylesterase
VGLQQQEALTVRRYDYGGTGEPVLLMHGLCGYAGEWSTTTDWLTATHHVYAFDARGHGHSERRPADVSRAAHVADAVEVLAAIGPAVVVGQSLGGHTALLLAAGHPELVRSLVLVESGPNGPGPEAPDHIDRWLAGWPIPFPDRPAAVAFLGGGAVGAAWAGGLEHRDGGWWPRFDRDVMVATIAAAVGRRWDAWDRITVPTLVVKGGAGYMDADEFARMAAAAHVTAVEVPGAGHDVHLDSPDPWRVAVSGFLR